MYQLYPLLLCLMPVHTIYGENMSEISLKNYFFAIPIIGFITVLGICGMNVVLQNLYLTEFLFCFNFFALIYARFVFMSTISKYKRSLLKYKLGFVLWYCAICFIFSMGILKLHKFLPLEFLSKVLFWGSLVVTFFVIIDIINKLIACKQVVKGNISPAISSNKDLPDIYHILADAHVGFAIPEFCDKTFKQELEKRGFSIYENAKSNYTQTNWSVPSMFSMDYIDNIVEGEGVNKNIYPSYKTLAKYGNNKWFDVLKSNDYKLFFSVTKPFNHLVKKQSSEQKFEVEFSNKILETLFFISIFGIIPFIFAPSFTGKYLFYLIKKFKFQCIKQISNPKYCFLHFLAPHRPYLFDENGVIRTTSEMRNEKNYFSYQKFINKQIIELVDEISISKKENSVIIIHGDHSHLASKHNILLAIRYPSRYSSECLAQNTTLVNLFRGLQGEIFGCKEEFLKNKYYLCCGSEIIPSEYLNNEDTYQLSRLETNNFSTQLKKLAKKYKGKKVVLYGAGIFLKSIQRNYDLSCLNIVGVSDLRFDDIKSPVFDEDLGYNKISPFNINDLGTDIVLITALEDAHIEKYFVETLFKQKGCQFRYDSLFKTSLMTKIMEEFQ